MVSVPCTLNLDLLGNEERERDAPPCEVDIRFSFFPSTTEELAKVIEDSVRSPLPLRGPKCSIRVSECLPSKRIFLGYIPLDFASFDDANGWLCAEVDSEIASNCHYTHEKPGYKYLYEIVPHNSSGPFFPYHRRKGCGCGIVLDDGTCDCCCRICGLPRSVDPETQQFMCLKLCRFSI